VRRKTHLISQSFAYGMSWKAGIVWKNIMSFSQLKNSNKAGLSCWLNMHKYTDNEKSFKGWLFFI
jgi:hypothetical protein